MKSPEYELARGLIGHLRGDEVLAPMVLTDVFDDDSQLQGFRMAMEVHGGAIVVAPQDIAPLDNRGELRHGVFEVRLAVGVFVSRMNLSQEEVYAATARTLARVCSWQPQGNGIPYTEPVLERVEDVNPEEYENLVNVAGRSIVLRAKVNYQRFFC